MPRSRFLLTFLILTSQVRSAQDVSAKTQAASMGLFGPVHVVLTEKFDYASDPKGKLVWSTSCTYDLHGYKVEEFRYEGDGTLHSHAKITRNNGVMKTETTSVIPEENRTEISSFGANGVMTQTDVYDQNGGDTRTTFEMLPRVGNATIGIRSRQQSPAGDVKVSESRGTTDPATGVNRYTNTADGKTTESGIIEQDGSELSLLSARVSPDGSFSQIERKPDGTGVIHSYSATTKTHEYTTTDQEWHVIETIQESPSEYSRTTFHYDRFGRQIEMASFDRSGKLVSKNTTEYRNDNYENWIEQKQSASGPNPSQSVLVSVQTRTITYY
jgi:hypothetical protein